MCLRNVVVYQLFFYSVVVRQCKTITSISCIDRVSQEGVLGIKVVPPWPLATPWWRHVGWERSSEAGGVGPGAEESPCHWKAYTGCERAGRRKWPLGGRVSYNWDVRGVCQWRSTRAHVNRAEGGVRPRSPANSSARLSFNNPHSPFGSKYQLAPTHTNLI